MDAETHQGLGTGCNLMNAEHLENLTIAAVGNAHMKKRSRKLYIACEDMNFVWCESEVREIERMWQGGLSIEDMAKSFDRDVDEVAVLIMDLAKQERIKERKNGVFGRRRPA